MSENETDPYIEDDEADSVASTTTASSAPIVGPVSPNRNLQIGDYSQLFSSSITSMDGSQESYSDSELEMNQFMGAQQAGQGPGQSLDPWGTALRTVRATIDLTTAETRRAHLMSRTPSPSSPFSASPSTSVSRLIAQRSAEVARLSSQLQSYIHNLQERLPLAARIRAQHMLRRRRSRNRRRIVHFEENEQRVPPNAEVLRRGNSISDCSQCSSAEEDAGTNPVIPSHLEEWSYPGTNC